MNTVNFKVSNWRFELDIEAYHYPLAKKLDFSFYFDYSEIISEIREQN